MDDDGYLDSLRASLADDEAFVVKTRKLCRSCIIIFGLGAAWWGLCWFRYFLAPPTPWWYMASHAFLGFTTGVLFPMIFMNLNTLTSAVRRAEAKNHLLHLAENAIARRQAWDRATAYASSARHPHSSPLRPAGA